MIIEVEHLSKKYGDHKAVSDLSFTIEKGKVYGFLGPNGAGKSTTMNMMTGCLAASEGTIRIGGFDIYENPKEAKQLVGYLPEIPPLYQDRTVREYLTFVANAKKIKSVKDDVVSVMEETQITDVADRLIRNLSKGYKQRVGIAQAILGNPEVIILDEPSVGLDPKQIIEIRELIRTLGQTHTVILSSHILSEVQAVCDTIMIISKGKLVASDTPDNLETLFAGKLTINITTDGDKDSVTKLLDKVQDIQKTSITDKSGLLDITLEADGNTDGTELCKKIFFAFADSKIAIIQMTTKKASLEDIFIELTTNNSDDTDSEEDTDLVEETSETTEENGEDK